MCPSKTSIMCHITSQIDETAHVQAAAHQRGLAGILQIFCRIERRLTADVEGSRPIRRKAPHRRQWGGESGIDGGEHGDVEARVVQRAPLPQHLQCKKEPCLGVC